MTTKDVHFGPGALGITFVWEEDSFIIQSFPKIDGGVNPNQTISQKQLRVGDILVAADGVSVERLPFEATVQQLKKLEHESKVLTFRVGGADSTGRFQKALSFRQGVTIQEGRHELEQTQVLQSSINTLVRPLDTTRHLSTNTARSSYKPMSTTRSYGSTIKGMKSSTKDLDALIKIISPVQTALEQALIYSPTLAPFSVQVRNESYWYRQRRKLGPKRHMHYGQRYDKRKEEWEAYIYTERYNLDTGGIEPQKKSLGYFPTQHKAFRKCEETIQWRDGNPGEFPGDKSNLSPDTLLATHFRVLVVSDAFIRKSRLERVAMVYASLLEAVHQPESLPLGMTAFTYADHRKIRGFSGAIGPHVLALPIFRHLSSLGPAALVIECKTPGQWDPERYSPREEEVFGKSSVDHTALADDEMAVTDEAHADRLKLLLLGTKALGMTRKGKTMRSPAKGGGKKQQMALFNRTDMLGVVANTTKTSHSPYQSKKEGIYGHFYHDVDKRSKDFIMSEYNRNIKMVKAAQKRRQGGTDQVSEAGESSRPGSQQVGDPKGNSVADLMAAFKNDMLSDTKEVTEAEIIANYQLANRSLRGVVRRVQRQFRLSILSAAARYVFCREYAALKIQRVLRGYYARVYTGLLAVVSGIAATKIQTVYRKMKARLYVEEVRRVKYQAQITIARVYKGHLAKRYIVWVRNFQLAAIQIQRLARGFLARCRFRHGRGAVLGPHVFEPMALLIQQFVRGFLCRKWLKGFIRERLHWEVVVPCARAIQRVFRGHQGRKISHRLQVRKQAAMRIQGLFRGVLLRKEVAKIRLRIKRHWSAVRIQKMARGYATRRVFQRRLEKRHKMMVVIPAIINIQRHIRGYLTRKTVMQRRRHWFAALKIQAQFRTYKARLEMLEKWREMCRQRKARAALVIQTRYRAYKGRRTAKQLLLEVEGRRLYAARIIMRSIIRYQYSKKWNKLRDKWRVEQSANLLLDCKDEVEGLVQDIDDIDIDIEQLQRYVKRFNWRVQELREFRSEATLRLPQVENEIDDLTMKDIEEGWGEALESEWVSLNNRLALCSEETRQLKIQIRNCEDDITKLKMERDDYEVELEHFGILQVSEMELLGRMEIERDIKKQQEAFRRKVYRQKTRWKDSSTRRKVIMRNLDFLPGMQAQIKDKRTLQLMGSVSSEKHWDREDQEAYMIKMMTQRERRRRAKEANIKGYRNEAVSQTFDSVVSSTMEVIKATTHAMRRPCSDLREDPKAVCPTCGKVFCMCPNSQCYNAVQAVPIDDD